MLQIELGAHLLQPVDMHPDGSRAEVVASGKRDAGSSHPGEQSPENQNGRPHLADQIERCLGMKRIRHINGQDRTVPGAGSTDMVEDLSHYLDVENARDVVEAVTPWGEKHRHHVLQGGVLGTVDGDPP